MTTIHADPLRRWLGQPTWSLLGAFAVLLCLIFVVRRAASAQEPARGEQPPRREKVDVAGDGVPAFALCRLGTNRFRHVDGVVGLTLSRDGTLLVSHDHWSIYVWKLATGELQQRIDVEGPTGAEMIAISPDGSRIAMRDRAGLHVYDAATGKAVWQNLLGDRPDELPQAVWFAFEHGGWDLNYSDDGKHLVWHNGKNIVSWRAADGTQRKFQDIEGIVAYDRASHAVYRWNEKRDALWRVSLANGKETKAWAGHGDRIRRFSLSENGKWAIEGTQEDHRDKTNGDEIFTRQNHTNLVDTATGHVVYRWTVENARPHPCWLIGDAPYLVRLLERRVEFYDLSRKTNFDKPDFINPFGDDFDYELSRYVIAKRSEVLVASDVLSISRFDVKRRTAVPATSHGDASFEIAFSPNGRWAVTHLGIWDVQRGRIAHAFAGPKSLVLGFSKDSRYALRTRDMKIYWHRVETGKLDKEVRISALFAPLGARDRAWAYSPESGLIAASDGHRIVLIDSVTGSKRGVGWKFRRRPNRAEFSPSGSYLLTVGYDSDEPEVLLWDVTRMEAPKQVDFGDGYLRGIEFGPADELFLLRGAPPNSRLRIAVYDVASGGLLRRHYDDSESIRHAAFLDRDHMVLSPGTVHGRAADLPADINGESFAGSVYVHDLSGKRVAMRTAAGFRQVDTTAMLMATDDYFYGQATLIVDGRTLLPATERVEVDVSDARLAELWNQLAGSPAAAQTAIDELRKANRRRVAEFMRSKLRAKKAVDAAKVGDAVAALVSSREAEFPDARATLKTLGVQAAAALRKTLAEDDVTAAAVDRINEVLVEIGDEPWTDVEEIREIRAVRALDPAHDAARQVLGELAEGDGAERLTRASAALLRWHEQRKALPRANGVDDTLGH